MATNLENNRTATFGRALASEKGDLSPDAARSILGIELSPADRDELRRLAGLAKERPLSREEEANLENYRHVGRLLELMKSKARISLKRLDESVDEPRA